jgi:hypothetical protein
MAKAEISAHNGGNREIMAAKMAKIMAASKENNHEIMSAWRQSKKGVAASTAKKKKRKSGIKSGVSGKIIKSAASSWRNGA